MTASPATTWLSYGGGQPNDVGGTSSYSPVISGVTVGGSSMRGSSTSFFLSCFFLLLFFSLFFFFQHTSPTFAIAVCLYKVLKLLYSPVKSVFHGIRSLPTLFLSSFFFISSLCCVNHHDSFQNSLRVGEGDGYGLSDPTWVNMFMFVPVH